MSGSRENILKQIDERWSELETQITRVPASRMNEGGVIFGDGIEMDRIEWGWGERVRIGLAATRLHLVVERSAIPLRALTRASRDDRLRTSAG